MFQHLDNAIAAVLNDAAAPVELRNADVNFETPDRNFNPGPETVNLFFHELQENRELRDPVPITRFAGNTFLKRVPPLRVECTYLVTAWATQLAGPVRVAREHLLLGQAVVWLSRFPVIPAQYFAAGALADPPFPPPTLVAQMESNRNAGEFWSALGTAPRPAFHLKITIALDLLLEIPEGPPVILKEMIMKNKRPPGIPETVMDTSFEIAGSIRASGTLDPIQNAEVILVELGRVVTTDVEGHFRFSALNSGNFTLRASAAGFATVNKSVTIPGTTPNEYDIEL